eukprot:4745146-Amphidinium_carterae.1
MSHEDPNITYVMDDVKQESMPTIDANYIEQLGNQSRSTEDGENRRTAEVQRQLQQHHHQYGVAIQNRFR